VGKEPIQSAGDAESTRFMYKKEFVRPVVLVNQKKLEATIGLEIKFNKILTKFFGLISTDFKTRITK
jgi:hypothetical protein